jgi:glycerophosphoryl diester phosphodiesterase
LRRCGSSADDEARHLRGDQIATPAKISAHAEHSARTKTIGTYRDAVATNADYIELDIRRTADEELVAFHDPYTSQGRLLSTVEYAQLCDLAGYEVPKVADVLATIAGRAKGHLDMKETGDENTLVRLALEILGPGEFIITSREDASVAAIRSRFRDAEEVPVALSLGFGLKGSSRGAWLPTRLSELRPLPRLRACGADWVALDHRLAVSGVARRCRQQHFKVMVWTVNNEREIQYWLSRRRTDILVTDRPALAGAIRGRTATEHASEITQLGPEDAP